MFKIKRMDHVATIVNNLEESIEFYTNVLGFKFISSKVVEQAQIKNAMLDCGGETTFELVEFLDDREYSRVDGLYELVGFKVDNIDESIAELKEKGVEFIMDEPIRMGENDAFIFFRGPSGEKLELVQKLGND